MPHRSKNKSRNRGAATKIKGQKFGDWKLKELLGRGGNGEVWKAAKEGGSDHALKLLHAIDAISYERFKAEIAALRALDTVKGVILLTREQNYPVS